MNHRVFISYRRDDTGPTAGRMSDRLRRLIGDGNVFFDISAIGAGADFEKAIGAALSNCDAAAIFIGEKWLDPAPATSLPRIADSADLVRAEIRAALARDIGIVPVLVGAAAMPTEAQLPADIAGLARRNALRLRHERFDDDAAALVKALTGLDERKPILLRRLAFGAGGARRPRARSGRRTGAQRRDRSRARRIHRCRTDDPVLRRRRADRRDRRVAAGTSLTLRRHEGRTAASYSQQLLGKAIATKPRRKIASKPVRFKMPTQDIEQLLAAIDSFA